MKLLVILAFVLCISVVAGLKCYICSSGESKEACSKSQTETDCGAANDRCATRGTVFTVGLSTTKLFTKICATKNQCDNFDTTLLKACKEAKGKTCEANCCEKDLCNNGAAPMISILLMVVCTVVGFFR
ncbi:unnamed protein product [Porites evermanni]|uniref:UPAR/Ly6 domain-containing protein n=1 Tax=Porites evermanni TaxID=104178 RepID=A0ABN8RTY8_9CNID|nr:unnamed protein product [Porites evermanni]